MKSLYLLCFLSLVPFLLLAQSISEQLGGIRADFLITSDTLILSTDQQILIQRAEAKYNQYINASGSYGAGYGYGYQSFHLEFIAKKPISIIRANGKKRTYYLLQFFDKNEELISSFELSNAMINFTPNKGSKAWSYIYSIDLKDVPIVVLDGTHQLKITRYDLARSY